MFPLRGRKPPVEVATVTPPAEPSAGERAPKIDLSRVLKLIDEWTYAAQQCGATELANMIQDERIELTRRAVPAVPGASS